MCDRVHVKAFLTLGIIVIVILLPAGAYLAVEGSQDTLTLDITNAPYTVTAACPSPNATVNEQVIAFASTTTRPTRSSYTILAG